MWAVAAIDGGDTGLAGRSGLRYIVRRRLHDAFLIGRVTCGLVTSRVRLRSVSLPARAEASAPASSPVRSLANGNAEEAALKRALCSILWRAGLGR